MSRTAKRSKSLEIEPAGQGRVRFKLGLEDKSHSDEGDELIHVLEIEGEISLPDLKVLWIEPRSMHQPYPECGASLEPVRRIAGVRIGPGFRARVLEVMGRERGCTHFLTLVLDLSAAHTLSLFLRMRERAAFASRNEPGNEWMRAGLELEPRLENACIALRSDSSIIRDAKAPAVNMPVDKTRAHPHDRAQSGMGGTVDGTPPLADL